MNTVKKGNLFEEKAKQIITAAINDGKLGLIPAFCRVLAKQAYFSRDRNSNIIFDLSIEVWPEGAERCHLLYLIECKDYKGLVPINDIEEFVSKINQVVGVKAKGVFITTSKLQESAYNYAKSKDLMLIHVEKNNAAKILLHNSKRKNDQLVDSNLSWSEDADLLMQIGKIVEADNSNTLIDWDSLIEKFLSQELNIGANWHQPGIKSLGLENLSKNLIEELTIKILNDFAPTILSHATEFNLDLFLNYMSEKHQLTVIYDKAIPTYKNKKLNGYCDIENKTIYIDKELVDTGQFLFVLIHEFAHFLLHAKVEIPQQAYDNLQDSEFNKAMGKYVLINDRHWLEWQANQFSAAFLMPRQTVLLRLIRWQKSQGISKIGRVWLDNQPCNILDFKKMITILGYEFGVSRTILEYRMSDLGIITYSKDRRVASTNSFSKNKAPRSISDIFKHSFNFENSFLTDI